MSPVRRKTLLALTALLFSGVVQSLIFPPLNYYWLHPWALAPGFYVLSQLRGRRAFFAGWLIGVAAHLACFYWIAETVTRFAGVSPVLGVPALVLFAAFEGLYFGVFGWGLGYLRSISGAAWPFAGAAWFVTCEFLNPQLFPFYQGVALYRVPELFLVSSVTGILGVTFQFVLLSLLLVAVVEQYQGIGRLTRRAWIGSGLAVALISLATVGISAWQIQRIEAAEAQAPSMRIAIVQPNLGVLARRKLGTIGAAQRHVEQSRAALAQDPEIDVFLWSEGALRNSPGDPGNAAVFDFIRESGREIWTGVRTVEKVDGQDTFFNTAYLLRRDGTVGQRYDKVRLLPLGEYMPFEDQLPILGRVPGVSHFEAGDDLVLLDSETPARTSFLICYEAILREFVRTRLPEQTNLMTNVTFDDWFGDTSCPSQHLMLAANRSAELGIPMVRAATTGISAFVDARGVITHQSALFTQENLVADVRPIHVPTFYGAVGDWFPWGAVLISLSLLMLAVRQDKKQRRSADG
jgi:apolipoprotein N-acyltransferase